MTFREKLKEDHPRRRFPKDNIGIGCPSDYGYETKRACEGRSGIRDCTACWNRNMPNTETKAEILKEIHEHFNTEEYDIGYAEGLEQGLNDAWELANKIWDEMGIHERDDVFGFEKAHDVMKHLTPQEALAKLKAYEEQSKIEVGDVVAYGSNAVEVLVTEIDEYDDVFGGIKLTTDDYGNTGGIYSCRNIRDCKKTGKHIDIKSILDSIGE